MMLMSLMGAENPKGMEAERRLTGRAGGQKGSDCSHHEEMEELNFEWKDFLMHSIFPRKDCVRLFGLRWSMT